MSKSSVSEKRIDARGADKIWNASFIMIFVANSLMNVGAQMSNALLGIYVEFLGYSPTVIGLVVGCFAYTSLVFKIVSGPALDSFNRVAIVSGFMLVLGSAFLCYALSDNVYVVTFGRLLQGFALAFTTTGCLALAADVLPQNHISKGIGYFSLAQAACMAFGPAIGLFLSTTFSFQVAFLCGAAFCVIGGVTAAFVRMSVPQKKMPFKISLNSVIAKEVIPAACVYGLLMMVNMSINSFLIVYGIQQGMGDGVGLFFTVYAVAMFICRPIFASVAEKHGTLTVLVPAAVCYAVGIALIAVIDSLPLLLVDAVVLALGFGISGPVIQGACMKGVAPERRGASSSTCYFFADVGSILGPAIGGAIATEVGYQAMWLALTIPILAALVLLLLTRKRFKAYDSNVVGPSEDSSSRETDEVSLAEEFIEEEGRIEEVDVGLDPEE